MEVFTYRDYIKCIHTLRLNAVFGLAEDDEKYNLEIGKQKKKVTNVQDKIMKKILKNKREVVNIINDFIGIREKIKEEDLVKYTNSYVTKKYKAREGNIIYKLKNKDIFFLIEHQSSNDNNILFKMLNYCVDIIYDWNSSVKIKKEIKYPIVVPIVIYTGTDKWNISDNFTDMQISDYIFKNYKIDFKYNLIEINKIAIKSLIQKNTLFSYTMALEKTEDYENFKSTLSQILLVSKKNKDIQDELYSISSFLLENLIEDSYEGLFSDEIYFKIEGGVEAMANLYEKQVERFKKDIRECIKKYTENEKNKIVKEIIKNLINNNSSDEFILKVTNISKSELEEYKKELLVNK